MGSPTRATITTRIVANFPASSLPALLSFSSIDKQNIEKFEKWNLLPLFVGLLVTEEDGLGLFVASLLGCNVLWSFVVGTNDGASVGVLVGLAVRFNVGETVG